MAQRSGLIHLHCGDAAAAIHRKSGLPGELRVWRDSPAVGPWASVPEDLAALRSAWWGQPGAGEEDLPQLQDLVRASDPILWFGPDPWEQACLLWVLAEMPEGVLPDLVPLSQGVGRLVPSRLPRCFADKVPLGADTLQAARALWRVFLAEGWGALGEAGVPTLPELGPALARLAEDHPPTGLGRTRRQIQAVVDRGLQGFSSILHALEELEDPRHGIWYGDLYVARVLGAMGLRV